ncbi:MAG: ACT domain-containing protein [bacterium]
MPLEKQLSIFVKNKVGSLSQVSEALSQDNINIRAVYTVDDVDWGIIGLIPDDMGKAKKHLHELGYKVAETTVLTIELDNEPGALAKISKKLSEQNINIVQTFATAAGNRSLVVLLTTDDKKAEQILGQ